MLGGEIFELVTFTNYGLNYENYVAQLWGPGNLVLHSLLNGIKSGRFNYFFWEGVEILTNCFLVTYYSYHNIFVAWVRQAENISGHLTCLYGELLLIYLIL